MDTTRIIDEIEQIQQERQSTTPYEQEKSRLILNIAKSFKEINENLKVLNEDLAVTNGIASQYDELANVWSTFVKEVIPASIPDDSEAK